MVPDEMKQIRDSAIESMKLSLDSVEPIDAPHWLLSIVALPVFVREVIKAAFTMIYVCLKSMLILPFTAFKLWLDMVCIIYWYLGQIVDMMSKK